MEQTFQIKSRFWVDSPKGTYLGEGRIRLLQQIQVTGSISAAAKALGISYNKAWKMVDVMNAASEQPVVQRLTGGKKGGGTVVTPHGVKAIEKFNAFKKQCNAYIDETFKSFEF
jgi:molybdate transport system regulatory protein